MTAPTDQNHQRDSSSLRVLGTFFAILGVTVMIATYWELDQPRAALVNLVSGLVLTGIGVGSWIIASRLTAPSGSTHDTPPNNSEPPHGF